jgi:hypothetical protein
MMKQIFLAAAILAMSAPAFAQGVEFGPGGVQITPPHHRRHHQGWGGDCRELRAACMHKEELGEEGRGNCRRYRQTCGREY